MRVPRSPSVTVDGKFVAGFASRRDRSPSGNEIVLVRQAIILFCGLFWVSLYLFLSSLWG